jgi:RimJ/RimL family protein N-acetyltransferase
LRSDSGVTLRPWNQDDADAVVDAYEDPEIQRWHFRHLDRGEAREWIDSWAQGWRAETDAAWAICEEPTVEAAGHIAIRHLALESGWGSLSYWIRPAFRQRGLATAATRAVARWALGDVGLHRMEIRHSIDNPESCSVAVAAGFPYEGTMRGQLLHADGWHDVHLHARLADS